MAEDAKQTPVADPVDVRHAALEACGMDARPIKDAALGIAFSGGGIRSATISLGIAQAFARNDRLLAFDYMSTVSGGGYFGSFLRSLYICDTARGPRGETAPADPDRFAFANRVLCSEPHQRELPGPKHGAPSVTNPIWWLREHSRYLAPSGPTDYVFAMSHIARNWLAMLYVYSIAIVALFTLKTGLIVLAVIGVEHWSPLEAKAYWGYLKIGGVTLSPLMPLVGVMVFLSLSVGIAFWITEAMFLNPGWLHGREKRADASPRAHRQFLWTWLRTLAGMVGLHVLVGTSPHVVGTFGPYGPFGSLGSFGPFGDAARIGKTGLLLFQIGEVFAAAMLLWSMAAFVYVVAKDQWFAPPGAADPNPTAELRRVLTQLLSKVNQWGGWIMAIAVIDTAAIWLNDHGAVPVDAAGLSSLRVTILLPLGAFLVKKLPEWLAKATGAKRKLSPRIVSAASLAMGVSLYGISAVVADSIVHRAAWQGSVLTGTFDGPTFTVFAVIVLLLAVFTGCSSGFINLSSLHAFYAARLTRAYIGATNLDRLKRPPKGKPLGRGNHGGSVNVNKSRDYIDVGLYQNSAVAAPIHLINVTLNETIGASSLVDRARKGALMTFGPEGVWIGARGVGAVPAASWQKLLDGNSEPLGVGQLCAISGAAASAGMGRMTTLGGALAFTFANVRLGYWWTRGRGLGGDWERPWAAKLFAPIETFVYLFDEMTARYSRSYRRLYLSDGGHFENSGALELVRRGCKLSVVADNGCDPQLAFGDLEILIRTSRLDLGRNIEVASADDVAALVGADAASLFFNGAPGDWRGVAATQGGEAFALLLNVSVADRLELARVGQIIWLKPRQIAGMAEDVAGYAKAHAAFPHESTGDQFFDEAQWESYRRLGVEMAYRLLSRSEPLKRAIPAIAPRPKHP